jgi:hypothetical protein
MTNFRTALSGIYTEPCFKSFELSDYLNREETYIKHSDFMLKQEMVTLADSYLEGKTLKQFKKELKDGTLDINNDKYDDLREQAIISLDEAATILNHAWLPRIYDEDIALKCNLTPFTLETSNQDYKLLSLSGGGMRLTPRLELYQALAMGSIDERSELYNILTNDKSNYIRYFEDCTYKGAIEDVKQAVQRD